jgi:hypothetical protein
VAVPVMQIGVVRVRVPQWRMPVPMRVRLRNPPLMCVLVVPVMPVAVLVFQRLMLMPMVMTFGEVHP